ncbi:MAG: CotH kinase family protein, partial [Muribaculaceae bacterium]|nr:CotH kinase family protein [Muribaculaceae bacterium]
MRSAIFSVILLCISIFSAAGLMQARTVNVYRNDKTFNQFRLADSISLTHSLDSIPTILTSDSVSIPLASIDSIVLRTVDVPVLRFSFPERPELTWVPDKDNYISAILSVEGNGMVESLDSLPLTVKGRGNSTWWFPKKPMRLKFKSKTSLCEMTKAKSYVLLADCMDASLMHNAIAFWVAKRIGLEFSNDFIPCHVYVNDTYAGAYLLTHKIGINKASVNIDESKGALFELSTEFDEDFQFRSAVFDLPLMIKDPDLSDLVAEMTESDFETYKPADP